VFVLEDKTNVNCYFGVKVVSGALQGGMLKDV
jgi:hypothetical protein